MPYDGNAGDSLIQLATARLLADLGIHTTADARKADLILVPGGNPTMWPGIGVQRWLEIWRQHPQAELVVGPAGFRTGYSDWPRAIAEHGHRVTGLFARDPDSFRHLETAALRPDIRVALSHDPALYLRESEWIRAHRDAATADYDLHAFRNDHEANLPSPTRSRAWRLLPGRLRGPAETWLAQRVRTRNSAHARRLAGGDLPILYRDVSREGFDVFTEVIRAARTVHTDRLHVMLLAAMLGKTVFAYATSHAKLEGAYRHSLAGWADVRLVAP